jgi:hypothetical protein
MSETNPTAMSPAQVAEMLTRAGDKPVTEADVAADLEAGAPRNDDGTVNFLHYTAWLTKKAS